MWIETTKCQEQILKDVLHDEQALHIGNESRGELLSGNVSDAVQGQGNFQLVAASQVQLDSLQDETRKLALLTHKN
jgi:hypothetical protein